MKPIRDSLAILAGGVLCACSVAANPAFAKVKIVAANLSIGHHADPPKITIRFYENINAWDATGLPVRFVLRLYAKANVSNYLVNYSIYVPSLVKPHWYKSGAFAGWRKSRPRIVRLDRIVGEAPSNGLGALTTQAINRCRTLAPNGRATRTEALTIPVRLFLTATRSQISTQHQTFGFNRFIAGTLVCEGLPASQRRKPSGPRRNVGLTVTRAAMKVSKFNRQCPRRIAVRVTMRGNKDGRVRYVLRRSNGADQPQTLLIRWRGGNRYRGSFDHQFQVRRSRVVTVWVEHKGRQISGRRRIRVDCSRPWVPKNVPVQ